MKNNYEVFINNKKVNVKDGFVLRDEYNEKLDSGTIVVIAYEDLHIEPFDLVRIQDTQTGIDPFYFEVDNVIRKNKTFTEPICYEYTINLFSCTKALERITLPSISITQPLSGTKRTIYEEMSILLDRYAPKVRVYVNGNNAWEYQSRYDFSYKVKQKFDRIVCPEFSWNEPTLKEVLDDLMKVDDCLCIVKEGVVIDYFNLNQVGNDIDITKLSEQDTSMASGDYISELSITMKNSIGKNLIRNCEYIGLRSEGAELDTNNGMLITSSPIYNIKSVKACVVANIWSFDHTVNEYRYCEVDITDFVAEEDLFNILSNDPSDTANIEVAKTRKRYNLYYKRGDNKIKNFGEITWFKDTTKRILDLCGKNQFCPQPGLTFDAQFAGKKGNDIREIPFKVEYETLADRKMKVGKYLPVKNGDNTIFDNQPNSYVNVQLQSIFEYAKANRLGNEIRTIYAVYNTLDEVPSLGDHINDDILFSRELSIYGNHIMFKGLLTKHYVLDNYFTSVASKRRSWQIARGSEALTRHEITKVYCEFSFREKNDKILDGNQFDLATMLVSPIRNDTRNFEIKNVILYTANFNSFTGLETKIPSDAFGYLVDTNVEAQGMSLCINFGFNDNYSAGYAITVDGDLYKSQLLPYTDGNGKFDRLYINVYGNIDPTEGKFVLPTSNTVLGSPDELKKNLGAMAKAKPIIFSEPFATPLLQFGLYDYDKDNREIIKHTIQFEFCSDTKDIIITEKFVQNQDFIKKLQQEVKLYIITKHKDKYVIGDKAVKGVQYANAQLFINKINDSVMQIFVDGVDNTTSWGIADSSGNLLIGVNGGNNLPIYLNLLSSRDDNVYESNSREIVVGKMWQYTPQ